MAEKQDKLSSLLDKNNDELKQLENAIKQGNEALLDLQYQYELLADKKRRLLREIDDLLGKKENYENKIEAAESLYGKYLSAIKEGRSNDV